MTDQDRIRFERIWTDAQSDRTYTQKKYFNGVLEKKYFAVLETLPVQQQNTIQDFLMSCEDMSWRMLEYACEKMRFPDEK